MLPSGYNHNIQKWAFHLLAQLVWDNDTCLEMHIVSYQLKSIVSVLRLKKLLQSCRMTTFYQGFFLSNHVSYHQVG
jgi:hypothetical protein